MSNVFNIQWFSLSSETLLLPHKNLLFWQGGDSYITVSEGGGRLATNRISFRCLWKPNIKLQKLKS